MEREFKGVWIPAEIWLDKRLTLVEKALLAEVDSFTGNGKSFHKCNETIQTEYGISRNTIARAFRKLQELDFVEVNFNGRVRHVRIRAGSIPKMGRQSTQNGEAASPNDTSTNTIERTKENTSKKRGTRPKDLDEVLESFKEVGAEESEALAFFDYYEANGWTQGRNKPIKDWKAAARGWIRRSHQFKKNERQNQRTGPADGSLIAEHLRRLAADSGEGMG
jgi:DNA-binding transcriptional regulator YhcF (GntR family)